MLHHLQRISVLVFLVSSMGATGLALTPRAIAAPLRDWRFVARGLGLNFILAPALAWLITRFLPLDRGHAAGLLLLGGAAGAPFLPKLVEIAGDDLARAGALLGLLTAGTILFLPFALPLLIPGFEADPWEVARPLLLLIISPLALGMLLRKFVPALATGLSPVLAKLGNLSLLLLFAMLVVLNAGALIRVIGSGAIFASLIFFASLFGFGWICGGEDRAVLGLATAARNFGAALAPAGSCFRDPNVMVMIVVGAVVCLVVSFSAARWMSRLRARSAVA